MISTLIYLIAVVLVLGLLWYALNLTPLSEPVKNVAKGIFILVLVIWLLRHLGFS